MLSVLFHFNEILSERHCYFIDTFIYPQNAIRTWFLDITSLQQQKLSRMFSGSVSANVNEKSRGMPRVSNRRRTSNPTKNKLVLRIVC